MNLSDFRTACAAAEACQEGLDWIDAAIARGEHLAPFCADLVNHPEGLSWAVFARRFVADLPLDAKRALSSTVGQHGASLALDLDLTLTDIEPEERQDLEAIWTPEMPRAVEELNDGVVVRAAP